MLSSLLYRLRRVAVVAVLVLAGHSLAWAQYGMILTGAGAVNRSMGGASVAAPLSPSGALLWNPASIGGLDSSEMEFGIELINPQSHLASSVPANTFGAGVPPIDLADQSDSNSGVFPIPSFGLVYRQEGLPYTFGLGVFGVAGFGVNYAASATNPILNPQPPTGFGLGALHSELQITQITPTISIPVTECLHFGFAPTVNLAKLTADPLFLADQNADGSYPPGTHSRIHAGIGFQFGLFYTTPCWNAGMSFKSKQWFETFNYNSVDENDNPRRLEVDFEYPLIASLGLAYKGIERWLVAADLRYIDFANAQTLGGTGFGPNGAVLGLGWDSVFALALGAQYQYSEQISLRAGYTWSENPIDDDVSSFNVASPLVLENTLYCGGSFNLTPCFKVSCGYAYAFRNSISGPLNVPGVGPVAGTTVTNEASAHAFQMGTSVKF